MSVVLTATEQNAYPPRVQLVVTGLTIGNQVVLYRSVAGRRAPVRGAFIDEADDTSFVAYDGELPFGVPVTYVAVVNGGAEYTDGPDTYDLPGGKVVLSDAITRAAAEVVLAAAGDQTHARDSTRMRVGGRNVVVLGPAGQPEGSYDLFTETWTALSDLLALLDSATQGIVQIRQPGTSVVSGQPYEGVDDYLAVDAWTVKRFSQDGSDPRRMTTIAFAVVDGWSTDLAARGFTYADLAASYDGLTYADLAGDYATYLDLVQGDFS